jgi:predicted RNA-binding Zn-ribbon protein involved in translation (DUF1610 family)
MADKAEEKLGGKGAGSLKRDADIFKCPECDFETVLPGHERKEGPKVMCPKCANPMRPYGAKDDEIAKGFLKKQE